MVRGVSDACVAWTSCHSCHSLRTLFHLRCLKFKVLTFDVCTSAMPADLGASFPGFESDPSTMPSSMLIDTSMFMGLADGNGEIGGDGGEKAE